MKLFGHAFVFKTLRMIFNLPSTVFWISSNALVTCRQIVVEGEQRDILMILDFVTMHYLWDFKTYTSQIMSFVQRKQL